MDDLVELEFRDGKRWVPGYLANMMADLETYRYTYDEAVAAGSILRFNVDSATDIQRCTLALTYQRT